MTKNKWFSPRRKRFWFVVIVILYTLLGFLAAPRLIENAVIKLVQDDLGRFAHIEKIEVNPYVLSLKVKGFELSDTDEVKLATFDEFFVNFQLSSLFNWAWTFQEIRLTGPFLYFERYDTGESRLDHLLADFEKSQPPVSEVEELEAESGAVRLLIRNLSLNEGRMDAIDNVPATPFETQLSPINISIKELNTLPDRHGEQSVTIQLPDGASLKWEGSLTLAPLDSEGELVLEGLHIAPAIAYLKGFLPLESVSATVSSRFQYRLQWSADGLGIDLDQLELELDDLKVSGLKPVTDFIDIAKISLQGGVLSYPEQKLNFSKLAVEKPRLTAWVNENGSLSVMDLLEAFGEETDSSDSPNSGSSWQLGIDEFLIEEGGLALDDRSVQPVAALGVSELFVKLTGISNAEDVLMPLELNGKLTQGGSYELNGQLGVLPEFSISATAATHSVPLSLIQSYVQQYAYIAIESGAIDSELEIAKPVGEDFSLGGSILIPALKVNDTLNKQDLLAWDKLDIDRFDLQSDGLHISQLLFDQVYGRLVVHEDQTTNVSALIIEQAATGNTGAGTQTPSFIIGGIRIKDGSMDFSDLSLPLPFATHVTNLDGTISTIDANSDEPANLRLEGQVDEYGLARIEGTMNMLDPVRHTDVTLEFRNLLMSGLSPYAVQFAGREIDEGKLDLGLVYGIEAGQLHGQNEIVLSDLVLGDKVDHPDAASLPLGLAVSLLKDSNGVIELDLPVEGDINDPEFQIGGVIWQAFSGLIGKIVSAPFRLLGKLIGVDSEDFGQFEFLAGRTDLTPPELEKIVQLGEALVQRPELVIEISGVSDPDIDIPAMKFIRLRDIAYERLDAGSDEKDDNEMMLDVEIRALVEVLFTERFPDITLDSMKVAHTAPVDGDAEAKPVLDDLAYATGLWEQLLASEQISEQDLADLAMTRAEVIRTAFLAGGEFDASRIVISEPKTVSSEDGEWVKLELAVK